MSNNALHRTAKLLTALLFFTATFLSYSAGTQIIPKACVVVDGEVLNRLTLYAEQLLRLKRTELAFKDFGGLEYRYSGVSLADILKEAGVNATKLQGEDLAKYVLVKSADGSEAVIAFAELDAKLTDQTIILADQMNGKPLASGTGPFRLIVPKDKERTRWIWEVNGIFVRFAKE